MDIVIHYCPHKSNVSADSLFRYPVAQSSKYDVCAENSLVAATSQEGIDKEGENSSSLSPVLSELEKSSCLKEVKNERNKHCVAAVMPELWDKTKGRGEELKIGKEKT